MAKNPLPDQPVRRSRTGRKAEACSPILHDNRTPEEIAEDEFDEVEEDLYLSPDGTMTTYYEGDEDDEQSEWYHIVPKFYFGDQLMSLADFDEWQQRHADDPFWQEHPNGIDVEWKKFE